MKTQRHPRLTIGVLPSWPAYEGATLGHFLAPLFHGIRQAAHEHDCNLLLACGLSNSDTHRALPFAQVWPFPAEDEYLVPVGPWNTDGLILVPPFFGSRIQHIRELVEQQFPLVATGTMEGVASVSIDNAHAIHRAVAHLVDLGHRRIAFVAGLPQGDQESDERLRGYCEAVRHFSCADDPRLIAYGQHEIAPGAAAIQALLSATSFTAVVCSNDLSAVGALQALKERGHRVPEDIALVGFDDFALAQAQEPPLTTVHFPVAEVGRQAVVQLLAQIAGQRAAAATVRVPAPLVVRGSCGALHTSQSHHPLPPGNDCPPEALVARLLPLVAQSTHCTRATLSDLCAELVQAVADSCAQQRPDRLYSTCDLLLAQSLALGIDPLAWHGALKLVQRTLPLAPQVVAWLDDAQARVVAWAQQQQAARSVERAAYATEVGTLTSRLLTAITDEEISGILAEHMLHLGVRRLGIARFAPEDEDPFAWSQLQLIDGTTGAATTTRMRSRHFPPPELRAQPEPFCFALLPLLVDTDCTGFLAFDTQRLDSCGLIVHHLAAALRNSRLYAAAAEGRKMAEAANRQKSRFLSTVSHELRTPLNLIVGLSELLMRSPAPAERPEQLIVAQQDVDRIYASARHLSQLIRDVLDLATSEVGQLRLSCELLPLAELLQTIEPIAAQLTRDKGLAWHLQLDEPLPVMWADRTRLAQVLLNLIGNAVKFTDRGSVTLCVEADGGQVRITVRDTGIGVAVDDQAQIFGEFQRAERNSRRVYGGAGIGLAVCKQLVQLHGGTIGVHSTGHEGGGSTFTVTLPVAPLAPPAAAHSPHDAIVVLSADPTSSLVAQLRADGFAVEPLQFDLAGAWLAALHARLPQAVLLDSAVAAAHAWTVVAALQQSPQLAQVPVLGYRLDEATKRGSMVELTYRQKPLDAEALAATLHIAGVADPGQRSRVLVVDDDQGTRDLHMRLLRAEHPGWQIDGASNGVEALRLLEELAYDLVLLDLMMPELDGFGVLQAMLERPALRSIPVVVLTAQTLTSEELARLNRGVAVVLEKGIYSIQETLAHLDAALRRERRQGSAVQRVVRQAIAYIHAHGSEPLTREQVADALHVGANYLTRCFQQELGITPLTYMQRFRIRRAKALLEANELTVSQIAFAVGFSDSAYFSRIFQREVGVAPGAYRRGQGRL